MLRRILRSYPISVVSARLGVRARTIQGWLKRGKGNPRYQAALESVLQIPRPSARFIREVLTGPAEDIARHARVSVEVARVWKRKKTIPLQMRGFLFDQGASDEDDEDKSKPTKKVRYTAPVVKENDFHLKRFFTKYITIDAGGVVVTRPYIVWLKARLRRLPKPKGHLFQFGLVGKSRLAADERIAFKSPEDVREVGEEDDEGMRIMTLESWSKSSYNFEDALEWFLDDLRNVLEHTFHLDKITYVIRKQVNNAPE